MTTSGGATDGLRPSDYTACGLRLIARGDPQHGTFQVGVYCDLPHAHEGNHHACIEWDDSPSRRIAQGVHAHPAPSPAVPDEFHCEYAPAGSNRCPEAICDCFIDTHPEDPFGLHPEAFFVPSLARDGQANDCSHMSATGIDTTPVSDPEKVWACDHCGLRWVQDEAGARVPPAPTLAGLAETIRGVRRNVPEVGVLIAGPEIGTAWCDAIAAQILAHLSPPGVPDRSDTGGAS